MFNRFKRLLDRPSQSFQAALPHTVAPVVAGLTAANALSASFVVAAIASTFALDNPNVSMSSVIMQAAIFMSKETLAAAAKGYFFGYFGTNLLLAGVPPLKTVESKFLLKPGYAGQVGLFSATLAMPVMAACVGGVLSNKNSNAPKMRKS